ncbi:redoxin domain-containing protein [Pleionea sp. CnH1-48]|uniref:glutathione peroxidase n=1 Tax=Pleionea sp. CnH1-48 TaxID=2954494 RepID=UPI002096E8A2|nr:glutathione peroxidase [Pleionea sp. CnH1-48]
MDKSIYDFTAKLNDGSDKALSDYKGKVLLIVNTASECGFTPQYEGLEALYETYSEQGFEILAFPCNQFGKQEPGDNEAIKNFCMTRFSVTFPLFDKVDVNGEAAAPVFDYLKQEAPGILGSKSIKWNFTKFLVGKDGQVIKRFAPKDKPQDIAKNIESALA